MSVVAEEPPEGDDDWTEEQWLEWLANAPPEELDTLIAANAVTVALEARGHRAEQAAFRQATLKDVLAEHRPDIVFNLVEGVDGQGWLAPKAPEMLAALGQRFTGVTAKAMAVTNDKPLTKMMLRQAGLATPGWTVPRQQGRRRRHPPPPGRSPAPRRAGRSRGAGWSG